ncbi:MAG: DNA/RNA non-specific endonuclease [Bacillota bacterium]
MTFKKSIKYIAILVLVAFTVTFGLPTQQLAYAKSIENIKQTKANIKYDSPTAATTLGNFVEVLLKYIDTMEISIEKQDLKVLKENIKDTKKALKDIEKSIQKELDGNSKTLDRLNAGNAKQKHNKLKNELDSKFNNFSSLFDKLEELADLAKELKGTDREALKNKLQEIENVLNPEQPQQPLGTLPHNNANVTPPEPAIGAGVTPAYSGTQVASAEAVLPRTPVDADLAETAEAKWTQEIKDLADSLKTPVKIYEYVRNNIDFEPYYGSRKGAIGTLNQLNGNDYDQASLLIAMLRYKGIPSRYVTGTVEVPIEKVIGWTGAKTPEAAVRVLGMLGTPTVSVVSGGTIVATRVEHTWVEAYVPYENYRGAGEMKGQKVWVPLDPSFKQYSNEAALDIKAITGLTDEQILEAFKVEGDRTGDSITNVNTEKMQNLMNAANEKLQAYIDQNNLTDKDTKRLMGGKKIKPENLGLLPLTLPYKTVTVLSETNTVPDKSSEKIGFSIKGNDPFNLNFAGSDDFNVQFKAVELYGKRITLSWVPATQEDAAIINNYGGLFKTPAYMIELKPQMKADGQVIAEGKAVGFGNRQQFTIAMGHVGRLVENVENPVTVGGIYSISFDYDKIDVKELDAIKNRIQEVKNTATEASIYTDEVMGEILNSVGKAYFGQLDAFNSVIAEAMKVESTRQVSEAMTGYRPNVKYMFYTPVEVNGGSFFIDVDHDVFGVTSLEGKKQNEIGFMMNTGALGSAMEHGIHEQVFQLPSVSSIKILTEASSRGIPIYTISKGNIEKLNELNVSNSVKTDITNAVNSGKIVTIPQKEIRYYNWQGSGYVVMDPETGAAGYMISGGLAGGSAAVNVLVTLVGLAALAWAIFDTVMIASAFLAAASPLAMIFFFSLYVISVINIIMTLDTIISYWQTGQYKYASQLMGDLLMNIAFAGVFKVLGLIVPGIKELFKGVKNSMDEIAELAAKYGDDVAEVASRYGPDAVNAVKNYGPDAANAIKNYGDDALQLIKTYGDDAVKAITNHGGDAVRAIKKYGPDAMNTINKYGTDAVVAITKYGDDAIRNITKYGQDGLTAITRYGDDLIGNVAKYGDEAVQSAIKYGDNAIKAMKNGIEPGLISKLDDLGVKPSDFEKFGIVSKEFAEGMAKAIPEIRTAIKTSTDELNKIIPGAYSRANGVIELELPGLGRARFDEANLVKDADALSLDRWDDFVESKWSETAGDLVDDAQEILINGQQYTKNGRIKALKPDVTYMSNGYTYTTDSLGNLKTAQGKLTLQDAPRNDYAQRVAGRLDRLATDDGGHLIATRFFGSGNLDNLVPMDSNLNRGAWKAMENTWAEALAAGREVTVNIEAIYDGVSQRPTDFIIEYFIDGKYTKVTFENIAGGGL